jgi:ATP-dependent RNA helicase DDX54/DBP10
MSKLKQIELSRADLEGGAGEWEEREAGEKQVRSKSQKSGFAQYSFFPELFLNLMINKLRNPTPVQKKTIPLIMEGKDVVVCYKTGSGKTLSYLLPIINKLQSHSQINGARTLILIPTRDLADQITKVLKSFLHKIDLRYTLILGGHTYEGQFESLSINPDIIIATPGRLMQLLNETDLRLSRVQTIVFDEADQLFGESKFQNELKEILSKCPSSQRLMFSATITPDLSDFALAGLRDYSYVHQEIALPETMKIDFMIIRPEEKAALLLYLLANVIKKEKVIVFVSTRFHVDYLLALVGELYSCYGVYGKMDMEQRSYALDMFRKRKSSILIVTDLAARGLDIPEVNFVVHYDYPSNHQIFVHRSGRTARAEREGHTIALMTYHELPYLIELATFVTKKLVN